MSNSNDVLNTIRDEMVDYIKSSRSPYTSDPAQVIRGAHSIKRAVNRPYIGIYMIDDNPIERLLGCDDVWEVAAELYCYMDKESDGVYDKLHQMKDNLIYFLTNDCSHKSNIDIGKFTPLEGGDITTVDYFTLQLKIKYEYSPT